MADLLSFKNFEKRYQLDNLNICGLPIWELSRNEIYLALINNKSNKKTIKPFTRMSNLFFNSLISIGDIFRFLLFKSNIDSVVLLHPRKSYIDGRKIDIYSHEIIKLFLKKNHSFYLMDKPSSEYRKTFYPKYKNILNLDFFFIIIRILSAFNFYNFPKQEMKKIRSLENQIEKYFEQKIKLQDLFEKKAREHRSYLYLFKLLFNRHEFKNALFTDTYNNSGFLAASKQKNILTYELQHGSPMPGKLNYDFLDIKKKFTPDYFLSYGDFFSDNLNLPISKKNIISIGFPYLSSYKKNNLKKKSDRMLFLSQHNMTNEMSDFINDLFRCRAECKITIRNHPAESISDLTKLFPKKLHSNIRFEDSNQTKLYESLEKHEICIGFFSTALFEATAFDNKVYSIKNSLQNISKQILDTGEIMQIDSCKNFLKDLELYAPCKKKKNNFFKVFNEEEFFDLIRVDK